MVDLKGKILYNNKNDGSINKPVASDEEKR